MLRRFLFQGTYSRLDQQRAYLAAVRQMELSAEEQYEHDHLYECLSILDSKASALLGFDSILVAASTIALSIFTTRVTAGGLTLFVALVFAGISSALNLTVITLVWTETADFADPAGRFIRLLEVRNRRTICYRLAWLAALLSLGLIVIGIVLYRRF